MKRLLGMHLAATLPADGSVVERGGIPAPDLRKLRAGGEQPCQRRVRAQGSAGRRLLGLALSGWCLGGSLVVTAQPIAQYYSPTNFAGLETNKAVVFSLTSYVRTNIMPSPWSQSPIPPPTVPAEIRERLLIRRTQTVAQVYFFTNRTFVGFRPESLINAAWTNLMALTNGRTPVIWSQRAHPVGWPLRPPIVRWNTAGLMWGMKGLTALSPCWEGEDSPGRTPVTALTRRHGYARGHAMGADGFREQYKGKRVWFLSANNTVVQVRVLREVVRTTPVCGRDYTILLFNEDLPASIEPIRVCTFQDFAPRYAFLDKVPIPLFMTEQSGNVSAGIPGFTFDVNKGGDSGSPNMIPLPGELIFYNGRTTSSPSPELQEDMDELCRRSGLNPAKYRMQWADLRAYPKY